MKKNNTLVGPLMQGFFLEHLLSHKNSSPQTIASYRDTFRLLLQFIHVQMKIEPVSLQITDMKAPVIILFLENLEKERHNSVRTRNVRLAAIRSFYRWVSLCNPENVALASSVLAIPTKRTNHKIISSLTRVEIDSILAAIDLKEWKGRRDHALFLTLYNTGARVSEIIRLRKNQIQFGESSFVHLLGKGRKERDIPIWKETADYLKRWFREVDGETSIAFPSARGKQLSRNGVNYLLKQIVDLAKVGCPTIGNKKISAHTLRHSTAMHLLQSGVDISIIALWLGHESIETTHIYLEADLETKERALQMLTPVGKKATRFKASDDVMAFLSSL